MSPHTGAVAATPLLLVFFTVISLSYCAFSEEPSDHTLRTLECGYLKIADAKQNNTFKMNGLTCCMCAAGYRYVGVCNSSHPSTTQCVPCESGTHIHWEPHLERRCIEKEMTCPSWMVYYPGKSTEQDRCVCPMGKEQRGRFCYSVRNVGTSTETKPLSPRKTPTESSATNSPRKNPTRNEKRYSTSTNAPPTLVNRITTSVISQYSPGTKPNKAIEYFTIKQTDDSSSKSNTSKPPSENGVSTMTLVFVALGIMLMVIVGFALWKIHIRYARDKNKGDDDNAMSTESQSPLISVKTSFKHGDDKTLGQGDDQAKDFTHKISEDAETQLSAIVIQESHQGQHNNRVEYSCQVQTSDPGQAPVPRPPRPVQNGHPETTRNRQFALNIATKFGESDFPQNEMKPLLRAIIGDHKSDLELDEIEERNKGNSKETIYKYMKLATQRKGKDLTPEYLLAKVKDTGLQTFVEIIEDEMKKPRMTTQHSNS